MMAGAVRAGRPETNLQLFCLVLGPVPGPTLAGIAQSLYAIRVWGDASQADSPGLLGHLIM